MESNYKKISELKEEDSVYITNGSSHIRKQTITLYQTIEAIYPFDKKKGQMDHIVLGNGIELKIWRKNEMTERLHNGTLNISSIGYMTYSTSRIFTTPEEARTYVLENYKKKRLALQKKIDEMQDNLARLNNQEKTALEIVS